MAGDKETPLMRQYNSIKAKHPDTVLLFRLGDFFETFGDDAVITAKVCGITLTKRNNGAAGEIPLAGFPHHQLDSYLPKLVRAGYRAAVCEQLEDPKTAKGIVKRDVVEVVTPGVAMYDKLLDARRNTYVAALVFSETVPGVLRAGIAYADASTAEFATCECPEDRIQSTLESIAPAEILVPRSQMERAMKYLRLLPSMPAVTRQEDWIASEQFARENLLKYLRTHTLKGFGVDRLPEAITAAGMVMQYISETQQGNVTHFSSLRTFSTGEYMTLDTSTRRNLEIVSSSQDKDASLVTVLDHTLTPMGGRLLRSWLLRPLSSRQSINERLDSVEALVRNTDMQRSVCDALKRIGDLERLIGKVCVQRATPRDLVAMRMSLAVIPVLHALCTDDLPEYLRTLLGSPQALPDVVRDIEYAIVDEPALHFGSGGIFRPGYHGELDEMRDALSSGKTWINAYQERLRAETGIPSLKVGMNGVFGYYVEISNAHKDRVPTSFQRRQTLTNAERYITPELKEREELIMKAESGLSTLEQTLFNELRLRVADHAAAIQHAARCIAAIDCLCSFARVSVANDYCRPYVADDDLLDIRDGRHPVVEKLLPIGTPYVPNSTRLNTNESQIHILTGPNMAGKSCYLRQVGLIVLMAHVGCFVPAASAHISLCDRIFTRVGAQDNIATGESTFLVEMQEAANILHHATASSLVLLDEVGRGTATFDGMSIAWALAEYMHDHARSKTLFATHYHELNDLSQLYDRIHPFKVDVQEVGTGIIFTRKVLPGSSDHSFGIHVARMAGLPRSVTERAEQILLTLESNNLELLKHAGGSAFSVESSHEHAHESSHEHSHALSSASAPARSTAPSTIPVAAKPRISAGAPSAGATREQISLFEIRDDALRAKLDAVDVNSLTPMQALQFLAGLKESAGGTDSAT